jgi:hypothetical protein
MEKISGAGYTFNVEIIISICWFIKAFDDVFFSISPGVSAFEL